MASHPNPVITVALPVPLRRAFDYAADGLPVPAGCRVQVSFNRRLQVGVALGSSTASASGTGAELKPILQRLDTAPLLNQDTLALLRWAADYYLHPVGEVIAASLPSALRKGKPSAWTPPQRWSLTAAGAKALHDLPARQTARRARLQMARSDPSLPQDALTRALAAAGWLSASKDAPRHRRMPTGRHSAPRNKKPSRAFRRGAASNSSKASPVAARPRSICTPRAPVSNRAVRR